jgi:hypothetical protein
MSVGHSERKVEHSVVLFLWWSWEDSCVTACESVITETVESCFLFVSVMFTLKKFQCHYKCFKASFFMTQFLQYGNLNFSKCHQVWLHNGGTWSSSSQSELHVTAFWQKETQKEIIELFLLSSSSSSLLCDIGSVITPYLFILHSFSVELLTHLIRMWKVLTMPQLK